MELESQWKASFPDRTRPTLYSSEDRAEDGWLPLSNADDFLVDSLASLDPTQLYTLAANNAEALQQAQQEWTHLERLAQHLKTRDPFQVQYKDPQELPRQEIFEERKEAVLYNYKYEAHRRMLPARFTISENVTDQEKFDCREPPEPFSQGGFIPNEKQYKSLMSAAKSEGREKNADNQKPYEINFAFEPRPVGTWIAKMLQPEAPPPPRTRAREAALNGSVGTSDRLTRFNGEKVPPTRGISTVPTDAPSPRSGLSTPLGGASPALKKRKIETVDITGALPRKRHPNQYTKRREAEEAGRLATAQEDARLGGPPVPMHLDRNRTESPPVKKKHPNQYTKRRELEEAERRAREDAGGHVHQRYTQDRGDRMQKYEDATESSYQASFGGDSAYRRVYDPVRYISPATGPETNPATGRPKHPNQYTKRREREEAERLAALQHTNSTAASFVNSRSDTPSFLSRFQAWSQPPNRYPLAGASLVSPPSQPQPPQASLSQPPQQPRPSIDTSRMNKGELRTHLFKDTELISLLERDHSWLNDDPEVAATWKAKILNSDYPVRTWAMLRKWKEWRAEGKDKRPRDKDGNRIREPVANAKTNGTDGDGDAKMADVESATVSAVQDVPLMPPTAPAPAPGFTSASSAPHVPSFAQSPARRPTRLRTRAIGIDSPQPALSSPLVNGVNARDLDAVDPSTSLSFSSKLQSMDQLDSNAKVDSWQDKPQQDLQTQSQSRTEYAACTRAGKGALRQLPKFRSQGTEEQIYPSSAEVDPELSEEIVIGGVSQGPESEDPLHGSDSEGTSESSRSSSPSTDPGERDTAYRSGTQSRPRTRARATAAAATNGMSTSRRHLRRTRSGLSARSVATTTTTTDAAESNALDPSNETSTHTRTVTRTRSREQQTQPQNTSTSRRRTESREQEREKGLETRRTTPAPAPSPVLVTKRSGLGLRPNPPKRTLSGGESEHGAGASGTNTTPMPTRRSLRNADRATNGSLRRGSVGS